MLNYFAVTTLGNNHVLYKDVYFIHEKEKEPDLEKFELYIVDCFYTVKF